MVSVAMAPSAALRATIDDMTMSTPRQQTVSSQSRARLEMAGGGSGRSGETGGF
jgi:hypothetical protein